MGAAIKPSDYECRKPDKYKDDISSPANVLYDAVTDKYLFANRRKHIYSGVKRKNAAPDKFTSDDVTSVKPVTIVCFIQSVSTQNS